MPTRQYWLVKSEPSTFSISALKASKARTASWEGVRNYTARIHLRAMKKGDGVLFYHSNADVIGIAGLAEVVTEAYPDLSALDRKSPYFDPKATRADPRWSTVDLRWKCSLPEVLTLERLRAEKKLASMLLLQKGNRLSVLPVTEAQWKTILALAGVED